MADSRSSAGVLVFGGGRIEAPPGWAAPAARGRPRRRSRPGAALTRGMTCSLASARTCGSHPGGSVHGGFKVFRRSSCLWGGQDRGAARIRTGDKGFAVILWDFGFFRNRSDPFGKRGSSGYQTSESFGPFRILSAGLCPRCAPGQLSAAGPLNRPPARQLQDPAANGIGGGHTCGNDPVREFLRTPGLRMPRVSVSLRLRRDCDRHVRHFSYRAHALSLQKVPYRRLLQGLVDGQLGSTEEAASVRGGGARWRSTRVPCPRRIGSSPMGRGKLGRAGPSAQAAHDPRPSSEPWGWRSAMDRPPALPGSQRHPESPPSNTDSCEQCAPVGPRIPADLSEPGPRRAGFAGPPVPPPDVGGL